MKRDLTRTRYSRLKAFLENYICRLEWLGFFVGYIGRKLKEQSSSCIVFQPQSSHSSRDYKTFPFVRRITREVFLRFSIDLAAEKEGVFRERKLLDVGNDYPMKGTKETIFRQIRQSPTYWKYRKHVHWYNLFNCIIQIGSGVGGH